MLNFEVNKKVKILISQGWLQTVATAFAVEAKLSGSYYFSLAFVGDSEIKKYNSLYRGKDYATDVLSFAEEADEFIISPGEEKYLGEIIIAVAQARKQAVDLKCSLKAEVARLLVHGLAHLIGYDHENTSQSEADKMLAFEKRVLVRLGLWQIFEFEKDIAV